MPVLRSVLFIPGVRADRFAAAMAAGADAVVFDLEDSVEPSRKPEARELVDAFFRAQPAAPGDSLRFVRVNSWSSPWWNDDLEWARNVPDADAFVLPKTELAATVDTLGKATNRPVVPLLETAKGILEASAIASARADLPAVLFGAEDLTAQIGIPRTIDGEELLYARSQVVLAATAAGTDAVDAVFVDLKNGDGLRRDALRAKALGFRGKMAIHPSQVPVINEIFTPTADERARAQRIVDAYDAAMASGEGVIRLDDKMIDVPVVLRAKRLLG